MCFVIFNGPKHQNFLYDYQKWHYSFALLSHKYAQRDRGGLVCFPTEFRKRSCLFWTLNTVPKSMFLQYSRWKWSRGLGGSRHASWPIKGGKNNTHSPRYELVNINLVYVYLRHQYSADNIMRQASMSASLPACCRGLTLHKMFCHVGLVGTWRYSVLAKNNTVEGSGWGLLVTCLQVWWEIKHATLNFQSHCRDFLATMIDLRCAFYIAKSLFKM